MQVLTELETIEKILDGYSIARYGDGEIVLCLKKKIGFQDFNAELSNALKDLASSKISHEKLIIAIPPQIFGKFSNYNQQCNKYWSAFSGSHNSKYFIANILNNKTIYGSSFITRINELLDGKIILNKFKNLWNDKNVVYLISSRNQHVWRHKLKVMFDNVKIIQYVNIPHTNAWEQKNKIIDNVVNNYDTSYIILCSCGPTATVLAYEFTCKKYQCIDIGHFVEIANVNDIEKNNSTA